MGLRARAVCLKTTTGPQAKEKEFQARHALSMTTAGRSRARRGLGRWVLTSKLCDLANGTCAAARSYSTELSTSILASDARWRTTMMMRTSTRETTLTTTARTRRSETGASIQLKGSIRGGEGGAHTWSGEVD